MGRYVSTLIMIVTLTLALLCYPNSVSAKKPPKPTQENGGGNHGGNAGNHEPGVNPGHGNGHNGSSDVVPPDDMDEDEDSGDTQSDADQPYPCISQAGNSFVAHVYFYQQDATTGEVIENGAWGKMQYAVLGATFKFVFNGHKLEPGRSYTLLYVPDPLPGQGAICLGDGIANRGGNVHIMNMQEGVDTGDLPIESDGNYPDGAQLILAWSDDVDCASGMIGWNPVEYIIGCGLITFDDTDDDSVAPPQSSVDIETATNGEDADEPSGPVVLIGDPVQWTYVVTNTSDQPLTNIIVTDSQGIQVISPAAELAPGESMTCTGSGIAAEGQYENSGTVVATMPDGTEVTDSDLSHYFGVSFMIDWANLLYPLSIVHTVSALNPTEQIYGQVWCEGRTNQLGLTAGLIAQVGFGPDGSIPENNPSWIWVDAMFNKDAGNNDEFQGQLVPEAAGAYDYAYRYSSTGGLSWVYADLDGTANGYDPAQAGYLVVVPSDDTAAPAPPMNLIAIEAAAGGISLSWDGVPDADLYRYEILRADAAGGPYSLIANVPGLITEYTDATVTTGTSYWYVVVAADISFNKSGYSNEVQASVQP